MARQQWSLEACRHLLSLPQSVLQVIWNGLLPADTLRLGLASWDAKGLAHSADLWLAYLQLFFPEVLHSDSEPLKAFAEACAKSPCLCRPACHVFRRTGHTRCPCVVRRKILPLRLGSLAESRSGSSSLSEGGFEALLDVLHQHFALELIEMSSLLDDTLESLDVLILCTTEGPELSLEDVKMLRLWVESGGALITSAFSNWSAYGHYAQRTVGWLGLQTRPGDTFRPHCFHSLPDVEASDANIDDSLKTLLQGPFGKPGFMVKVTGLVISGGKVSSAAKLKPSWNSNSQRNGMAQ